MTTERAQRNSPMKLGILAAAMLSTLLLTWSAYANFNHFVELQTRSKLNPPNEVINHPLDSVGQALAALQIQGANGNTSNITAEVWGGDREALVKHVHNIAVQKGWYPHSRGTVGVKIVLQTGEEAILFKLEEDPYGWVQTHQDATAPPKKVELGNPPAFVHLTTEIQGREKANWHGMGMVMSAGLGLIIVALMGMSGAERLICRIKEA